MSTNPRQGEMNPSKKEIGIQQTQGRPNEFTDKDFNVPEIDPNRHKQDTDESQTMDNPERVNPYTAPGDTP